jgi:hypothetical protein
MDQVVAQALSVFAKITGKKASSQVAGSNGRAHAAIQSPVSLPQAAR